MTIKKISYAVYKKNNSIKRNSNHEITFFIDLGCNEIGTIEKELFGIQQNYSSLIGKKY